MSEESAIDWASAARIALVVPGDSQVDDEFWRLLAPHAIPLVSRTTGADPVHMSTVGVAAPHTKSLAESSDLEVAADRLRPVNAVAAAYVDTSISFIRGPGGDLDISKPDSKPPRSPYCFDLHRGGPCLPGPRSLEHRGADGLRRRGERHHAHFFRAPGDSGHQDAKSGIQHGRRQHQRGAWSDEPGRAGGAGALNRR